MKTHVLAVRVTTRLTLILTLLLLFISACQNVEYPEDHEQLSQDERLVIRFSHIVGEQTPKGLAARRFAQEIKEKSNGYIEVQVFPNGYLYKDGEELDALLRGDIQMIAPATSKLTELVPEWEVIDLPFAFRSVDEVHQYLEGPIGDRLMDKLQQQGLEPLQVWDNGFKHMTNDQGPLRSPQDFSGLTFRIMPSRVLEDQFAYLGASTMVHSFDEVFQNLEQNIVDGQENTFSNIVSKDLHTLQTHMTNSHHGYLGYVVLTNQDFWKGLTEENRRLIQETISEVTAWEVQKAKEMNEQNDKDIDQCQCIERHTLTERERQMWEEALYPVYQNFIDRYDATYIYSLPKFIED
ncbi:DctP family TRAP transporter solute-binding subunit [Caldalkalibacillus salinus]|uniref:DctP family TRAP transporter solute-binding subunit n=1 Tax=Caldalkalibacillus salinus TaxID=2803787 RepID=UPI001F003080|nr:DctP family TRAP transporter solute-binding subunit [Caldalkalibacillus salinus]